MQSAPAIGFELQPSRWLLVATVLMSLLAALAIVVCAIPTWLKLALFVAVLMGAFFAIRTLRDPPQRRISHDQSGWRVGMKDGSSVAAELRQHARLESLIVLGFQLPDRRWYCLIAPDMIAVDTRRRLLLTLASLHDSASDRQPMA